MQTRPLAAEDVRETMIGLDPNATFETWLTGDVDRPAETRPTFTFRYATARRAREIRGLFAEQPTTDEQADHLMGRVFDAIAERLAGWRNIPDLPAWSADDADGHAVLLDGLLTVDQAWELLALARGNIEGPDLKKSASPSPTPLGVSAGNGDAATVPATSSG